MSRNAPAYDVLAFGEALLRLQPEGDSRIEDAARFVSLESRNHVLLETEPAWTRFLDEVRAFLGPADSTGARARRESTMSL